MKKTIEISADVQGIKSSIKEIDSLLKDTAKAPRDIKLFDEKELDIARKWADESIPKVQSEMNKIREGMKKTSDINMVAQSQKALNDLEKQLKRLQKLQIGDVKGYAGGSGAGGKGGGLGGLLGGGGGGISGMLKGAAMRYLGPLAVGMAIFSKGKKGYEQRMGEVDERVKLAGAMGGEQYGEFLGKGGPYQGEKYGFKPGETLKQANQLIRSVGDVDQLDKVQRTSKAYGLDPGELIQQAGGMRKAGGRENLEENFATLIGSAVSSNLDQGLLAEYMSETAQFTQQIASEGTADTKQVMRAVSGLVRQGGIFEDTARTTRQLGGLDQAIKGAEGPKFGFFATVMKQAMGGAGTGEDVLAAMQQGMFGVDTSNLKNLQRTGEAKDIQAGGAGVGFGKKSKALSSVFSQWTKDMTPNMKALMATEVTGIKGPAGLELIRAMESGKYSQKQLTKMEAGFRASPEEKALKEILGTLDSKIQVRIATEATNNSIIGTSIAPAINSTLGFVQSIESYLLRDKSISKGLMATNDALGGGTGSLEEWIENGGSEEGYNKVHGIKKKERRIPTVEEQEQSNQLMKEVFGKKSPITEMLTAPIVNPQMPMLPGKNKSKNPLVPQQPMMSGRTPQGPTGLQVSDLSLDPLVQIMRENISSLKDHGDKITENSKKVDGSNKQKSAMSGPKIYRKNNGIPNFANSRGGIL